MPQVVHSFRGENRNPRLKVAKVERQILDNASGLCKAIANLLAGHDKEFSHEMEQMSEQLLHYSKIEEHDLTKPF